MDEGLDDDGVNVRSVSSLRMNIGSSSRRSWAPVTEVWSGDHDVFERSKREDYGDDEQELKWAAIERLPTFERMRKSIVKQVLESGKFSYEEVDISKLDLQEKNKLLEGILRTVEEDNEKFLLKIRDRIDRFLASLQLSSFFVRTYFCVYNHA